MILNFELGLLPGLALSSGGAVVEKLGDLRDNEVGLDRHRVVVSGARLAAEVSCFDLGRHGFAAGSRQSLTNDLGP